MGNVVHNSERVGSETQRSTQGHIAHNINLSESAENLESDSSTHSLQLKLARTQRINNFSIYWNRLIKMIGRYEARFNDILELVDIVGNMIINVDIEEFNCMKQNQSKMLQEIILRLYELKMSLLDKANIYKTQIHQLGRYAFCGGLTKQELISELNLRQPTNLYTRNAYDDFGRVVRTVTVEKFRRDQQDYVLKTDKRLIPDENSLQQSVTDACLRFYNWFQISENNPKNILCVLSAKVENPQHDIVIFKSLSPYIVGSRLDQFIDQRKLKQKDKLIIAKQMISAVQYLHKQGYTHGDIKPQNFLCNILMQITLIDMDSLSNGDDSNNFDATLLFINEGRFKIPSFEADIWALGLSLYKLETNQKLIPNWTLNQYRDRDKFLTQYLNGYGELDSAIDVCLNQIGPKTLQIALESVQRQL